MFEEGGIPGNILFHNPNNARGSRFCSARAENLHPTQPNAENAVELPSFAGCSPFQDDFGEVLSWAVGGRVVRSSYRRFSVCVAEIVLKDKRRAGCCFGVFDGFGYLEEGERWI